MNSKTFHFKSQYLPFTDDVALGFKLHEFQVVVKNILNLKEECLFLNAPTASGKTLSFILPTASNILTIRRPKTLIISPTNLLIAQTKADIDDLIKEKPEIRDMKLSAINSKFLIGLKLFERSKFIKEKFDDSDIILSNPDIISLFLTGFYDSPYKIGLKVNSNKIHSYTDIFSEIDVIIFDEYHVYSEEELGKIMAFLMLSRLIGNTPKILFTSATPNDKLKALLTLLGFKSFEYNVSSSDHNTSRSRCIRGNIELTLTDQPIMDSLPFAIRTEEKLLYLFDHKIDAEKARRILLQLGLKSGDIEDLTGFSNRATSKPPSSGNERCIVSTNAAEQGLNLDVSIGYIEPGLYLENLLQRYGRIGRAGKSGAITIHLKSFHFDKISDNITSFSDLLNELENVFFKKETVVARMKRHFSAFMALCTIRSPRPILSEQIKTSIYAINDKGILGIYNAIIDFNSLVKGLTVLKGPHPDDIKDLKKWWDDFLLSVGFFRGMSRNVDVGLEREGGIMETTEDIIWVKRFCATEIIKKEGKSLYLIKSFKDVPSSVELEFLLPQGSLKVSYQELFNNDRSKFAHIYCNKVVKFLEDAFEDYGTNLSHMSELFSQISMIIHPEMLMPREVELVSESQII